MTRAEKVRVVLRAAEGPLTFGQIKALEPEADFNALWAMVTFGKVAIAGERGIYTYRMVREPRAYGRTPEQLVAAAERRRERDRIRYHTDPRRRGPAKPKPEPKPTLKPSTKTITWAVPIAPSETAKRKKVERPAETVAQWMARTGKRPERLGLHDSSTPFRHIGKAA